MTHTRDVAPVVQKLPVDSTIHQINHYPVDKYWGNQCYCTIQWIEINPVDSAIHLLNNWDQVIYAASKRDCYIIIWDVQYLLKKKQNGVHDGMFWTILLFNNQHKIVEPRCLKYYCLDSCSTPVWQSPGNMWQWDPALVGFMYLTGRHFIIPGS